MPTRSPDVVNEHRITLGRWEREAIKPLIEAKVVKDVGVGVGVAAVGIGGTYVAYNIGKSIYDWADDILEKGIGGSILDAILPESADPTIDAVVENDSVSKSVGRTNPVGGLLFRILGL